MVTRISGINSGMDIDGLVQKLMTAERLPQNKLKQKQQLLSWQQDAYRSINTLTASLRDSVNNMRFAANLQKTASSSSDPTKVTVTSNASATPGTHTIEVTNLATAGTQSTTGTAGISTLGITGGAAALTVDATNDKLNLTLNGVQKTVTIAQKAYATQADLKTAFQTAIDQAFGTGQITVGSNAATPTPNGFTLTPQGTNAPQLVVSQAGTSNGFSALGFTNGQSYKLDINAAVNSANNVNKIGAITAGPQTLTVNGTAISYSSADTLQDIMNRVNNSAAGVTMSYDSMTDKVSFVTKNTGSTAKVSVTDTGTLVTAMKLGTAAAGVDASIKLDGLATTQPSNSFTISGVSYNLLNTTPANTPITVTVKQDAEALKKTITDFVDKYNALISTLSAKTSEAKMRGFDPLSDEQKAAMKDTEIATWNQKAQSGILRGDSLLRKEYGDLRLAVSQQVTGLSSRYTWLSDIGIATGEYNKSDPTSAGKLVIDQAKLDTALATDPQAVINLFSNVGTAGGTDRGVAKKLTDISDSFTSSLTKKAGRVGGSYIDVTVTLGKQEYDVLNKITTITDKLNSKENYYYQMFTKMDTALGKSNAQMAWLQNAMMR